MNSLNINESRKTSTRVINTMQLKNKGKYEKS